MLKPGGTGNDRYELDANGKIVPRTSKPTNYYTTEWVDGKPRQVSHTAGPRVTPPAWTPEAQAADDAASQRWSTYLSSLPGSYGSPAPASTPAAVNPIVNTAPSLINGTMPTAAPTQAPQPNALLSPSSMTRQLSPQTMVKMKSPLQGGLFGRPLWKTGQTGFNI